MQRVTTADVRHAVLFAKRRLAQTRAHARAAEADNLLKRLAKLAVVSRVDERVETAVEVAHPQECRLEPRWYRNAVERPQQRQYKKRQPTGDERAHYDAKRFGGFVSAAGVFFLTVAVIGTPTASTAAAATAATSAAVVAAAAPKAGKHGTTAALMITLV